MVLEVVTLAFSVGYAWLVFWFMRGWKLLHQHQPLASPHWGKSVGVSLVIPFRNERQNLPRLVEAIERLNLSGLTLEVFWIDDQSEDDGYAWLSKQTNRHPNWKLLQTSSDATGKKAALTLGIHSSSHEWIACTDADCLFGSDWLQTMVATAYLNQSDLVSGPVKLTGSHWFQRLQSLEFMSLNAIGGACLALKQPVIANGANLMYRKSCWIATGGFEAHKHRASGDDDLLLHQLNEAGFSLSFCLNRKALVETEACKNFSAFMHQRLRWISKSGSYKRKDITAILAMVWLYLAGVFALMLQGKWELAFSMWFIKWVADSVFLWAPSAFYQLNQDWKWLPIVQLFYLPYVLIAGLAGNFISFQWKGRKLQ